MKGEPLATKLEICRTPNYFSWCVFFYCSQEKRVNYMCVCGWVEDRELAWLVPEGCICVLQTGHSLFWGCRTLAVLEFSIQESMGNVGASGCLWLDDLALWSVWGRTLGITGEGNDGQIWFLRRHLRTPATALLSTCRSHKFGDLFRFLTIFCPGPVTQWAIELSPAVVSEPIALWWTVWCLLITSL